MSIGVLRGSRERGVKSAKILYHLLIFALSKTPKKRSYIYNACFVKEMGQMNHTTNNNIINIIIVIVS